MLLSALTFTVMTTLVKFLGEEYPATVQTVYRQGMALVLLLPLILPRPVAVLRSHRPVMLLLRSLAHTLGMILAFYSYQMMPLAEANALSFTRTLWLVPLAIVLLGERVGPRRLAATVVGFGGVLLMLGPTDTGHMHGLPALAALGSALLFAFSIVAIKLMTRDHSTLSLMAWSAVLGFVLSLPPALPVWVWPTPGDLALLTAMGALGTVTQWMYMQGMAAGEATVMTPIDYTRLVFAAALGYALFGDIPGAMAMLGAAVVIASTLYITVRELRIKRGSGRGPVVD